MDSIQRVKDVSIKFKKDRKDIEDRIKRLNLDLKTQKKKKKNFLSKSSKEIKVKTIHALQTELRTKLVELEEFQSRIAEILSLKPPNMNEKLNLECETFSKHLPIYRFRSKILESIEEKDVTILVADTGSGKSTLVTQFLHTNDEDKVIYCCQPRRLAANSLMEYTINSLGLDPQEGIVAFDFNKWDTNYIPGKSKIVFTTNNGLLSRWRDDNCLKQIDVVIIDETHERTLSTDLLLGVMKKLHECSHLRQKSIKTLIMSATIDPSTFHNYFSSPEIKVNCISVPGKTFPVEVIYDEIPLSNQPKDYVTRTTSKILKIIQSHESGDVLAFLATPPEIEEAIDILEKELSPFLRNVKVYPLHSKVEIKDQRKLFSKDGILKNEQRVIISTNIAETSVTLPNITCVIDSGRQKEFSFDLVRNVGALTLSSISRNSALQRMGRAGRTRPGTCYRLYTKNDYDDFVSSSSPEILCLPLDQALLSLFHLGFSNPETFDFIDPPSMEAISVGIDSLSSLGAIEPQSSDAKDYSITQIGYKMIKLNLIPKLAHLMINTLDLHKDLILDVLIICGVLSRGHSIFYRSDHLDADKLKKLTFCNSKGDLITIIEAFKVWYEVPRKDRGNWARKNMISHKTMNETLKFVKKNIMVLKNKFNHRILQSGEELQFGCSEDKYDVILNLAYSSFSKSIAIFAGHPRAGYINSVSGEIMMLHPSSSINCLESSLKYVCYDKILTTSKTFILHVSMVKSEWLADDSFINDLTKSKTVRKYEGYPMMGFYTLKKYVFHKLKQLRIDLNKKISINSVEKGVSDFFEIEIVLDKGSITTWCHPENECIVITSVEDLLNTALEEVCNEKIHVPLNRGSIVLVIGASGRGITYFDAESYLSFKIAHINESDKVELPLKDIQELMTKNNINFDFFRQKSEPCLSFTGNQNAIKARSLILDQYSDVLKCKWNEKSFNQTSVWISYTCKSTASTHQLVKEFQETLDREMNAGVEVVAMPSRNTSNRKRDRRVDTSVQIRVNVPSIYIGEKILSKSCYSSLKFCTIIRSAFYVKQVFTIPMRAVRLLKEELDFECSYKIYFQNSGDDAFISVLKNIQRWRRTSGYPNLLPNHLILLIQGTKIVFESFSPSFVLINHSQKVKEIEDRHSVVIIKEKNVQCLSFRVFGLFSNRARIDLVSYFKDLKGTILTVPFDERQGYKGVLPTLIKKYGTNLMKLRFREGLYNLNICFEEKAIQLNGTEDLMRSVGKDFNDLFPLHGLYTSSLRNECSICALSLHANSNCRLQLCGHTICHECLQKCVSSADTPLVCPIQGCDTDLSVIDIQNAISSSESATEIFYEKCRKNYYKLSSEIKRCPMRFCERGVLELVPKTEKKYRCCYCSFEL